MSIETIYELVLADLKANDCISKVLLMLKERERIEDYETCQGIVNAIDEYKKHETKKYETIKRESNLSC